MTSGCAALKAARNSGYVATLSRWRTTPMAQSRGSVIACTACMVLSKVRSPSEVARTARRARASRSNPVAAGCTCSARMRSNGTRNSTSRSGLVSLVRCITIKRNRWMVPGTEAARHKAQNGYHGESMGFDPNGMLSRVPAEERLNVFALVIYIPDPLGRFLDDLRRELAPHPNPHAHVTVLPPRPLAAAGQARALTEGWAPFEIELAGLQIFPVTNVIYIQIGAGAEELWRMHAAM